MSPAQYAVGALATRSRPITSDPVASHEAVNGAQALSKPSTTRQRLWFTKSYTAESWVHVPMAAGPANTCVSTGASESAEVVTRLHWPVACENRMANALACRPSCAITAWSALASVSLTQAAAEKPWSVITTGPPASTKPELPSSVSATAPGGRAPVSRLASAG